MANTTGKEKEITSESEGSFIVGLKISTYQSPKIELGAIQAGVRLSFLEAGCCDWPVAH